MYDNWRNSSNDRYKKIFNGKEVCMDNFKYEEILNSPVQTTMKPFLMPGDLKFELE